MSLVRFILYRSVFACLLLPCVVAHAKKEILLLNEHYRLPSGVTFVDDIKVGDKWRFNCSYEETLEILLQDAIKQGGNLVKITEVKAPDQWSTCFRIKANVYNTADLETTKAEISSFCDSLRKAWKPEDSALAMLHVYRPKKDIARLAKYYLFVGRHQYALKAGDKVDMRLHERGLLHIGSSPKQWEKRQLPIESGNIYFINAFSGRTSC